MNKKVYFLVLAILGVILGGGCTKSACAESDYETFQVIQDSPPDGSTVPLGEDITFDWHHEESCDPYRYILRIYDPIDDFTINWPTT